MDHPNASSEAKNVRAVSIQKERSVKVKMPHLKLKILYKSSLFV